MKRSGLKMTGETYRLTPSNWGETAIMIDEDEVSRMTAEAFGIDISECDPDGDPNDRPETVDIAVDNAGKFYAILHPFEAGGQWHNENTYRECENPEDERDGSIAIFGNHWEIFDDEE